MATGNRGILARDVTRQGGKVWLPSWTYLERSASPRVRLRAGDSRVLKCTGFQAARGTKRPSRSMAERPRSGVASNGSLMHTPVRRRGAYRRLRCPVPCEIRSVATTLTTPCEKFGPDYAAKLKRRQGRLGDTWYLDEVFVTIRGQRQHLLRAVNHRLFRERAFEVRSAPTSA